ncbi:MAG: hypothetical protein U0169_06530 [Polyangiaceae bacterium]
MTKSRDVILTVAPPEMNVREARDLYLSENGFSVDGYDEEESTLDFFGIPIVIRNSEGRKRGLPFHDLHHVATGFGTNLVGESQISAWEIRSGLRGYGVFVTLLVLQAFALGLVLSPVRTLRAWRRARGGRTMFSDPLPLERVLAMTVGELRTYFGLPVEGIADGAPLRHGGASASPRPVLVHDGPPRDAE